MGQAGAELIESLDAVPCNEPHDAEAYATLELDISEYPGVRCPQLRYHFLC